MKGRALGFFAAVLGLAAIALLPLRWVVPDGLSAGGASGTVWRGTLRDADWAGTSLGDLAVAMQLLPLMTGERRLDVAGAMVSGQVIVGEGVEGFSGGVRLTSPAAGPAVEAVVGAVVGPTVGPAVGVAVGVVAEGVSLRFRGGQCVLAAGRITVMLPGNPVPLAGSPRCAGAAATLPLASADGMMTATAAVSAAGQLSLQQ